MSLDPAVLRALRDAGATVDMIIAAVEADAARDEARKEAKRAGNAARQARFRARNNARNADNALLEVTDVIPSPSPSPNEILNPNPTPAPVENTPARDEPVGLPIGASAEQWAGFVEMRRRIRKPLTARAQQLALRKLSILAENGQPPGAVLDQSTLNGWQGLFPLKDQRNGNRNFNRTDENSPGSTISAAARVFGGMAGR